MESCDLPFLKLGDSFSFPVQLFDDEGKQGIEITNDMQFTAQVKDKSGRLIATLDAEPYPDQTTDKGFVLFSFSGDTSDWPIGLAQTDIKLVQGDAIRHSQTIDFEIVRSITA